MRVAITGGGGFLGVRLARELLKRETLGLAGVPEAPVNEILLFDRVAPPEDLVNDDRVTALVGDLSELLIGRPLDAVDLVFHLAASVSAEAERDFDLGMANNLDNTRALFEECRRQPTAPVLVFASSVAVFGCGAGPEAAVHAVIADDTLPTPLSSYGAQKFAAEVLLADYTRRGFIRGRSVRLMTVTVRPGRPNAAASSFVSSIIREPLAGERTVCPVPRDTPLAVSSPRRSVEGLLRAATACEDEWGGRTAVNLPSLTVTPAEMLAALDRVAEGTPSRLVDWNFDPAIAAVVLAWPARFRTERAERLGLLPERDFDSIVVAYVEDR